MHSCTVDIHYCVKLALMAFCFVQLAHNALQKSKLESWSLSHCAFANLHQP